MKILALTPCKERQVSESFRRKPDTQLAPDVEVHYKGLKQGPHAVDYCYDEYLGVKEMMEEGIQAQKDGFDAIVINCTFNPAMEGLREVLDIPIVGAGMAAFHVASMLGDTFSVIDTGYDHWPYARRNASKAGLSGKLVSVRALNLSVAELSGDQDLIFKRIVQKSIKSIEEDDAHVIVFGCTGMQRYAEKLSKELEKYGVPVVEPLSAGLNMAEALVRLKLKQSKLSYPKPPL